jgi:hypothetical protein
LPNKKADHAKSGPGCIWDPIIFIGDKRRENKHQQVGYAVQQKFDHTILAVAQAAIRFKRIRNIRKVASNFVRYITHLQ